MINTKQKVEGLVNHLCDGLYEREEVMKLALLATISGESIFLLGPPGVGKSLIARRLKNAFNGGKSFEYLMTKFSTPDEVFGPISIKKLKEEDKYERLTSEYMPGATIVFLDEIWKASSSIQNALLTIINERVYRNGEQEIKVDIKSILTASNELPPNNASFGPLWDRLLIRFQMAGVKQRNSFIKLITDTKDVYEVNIPKENQISLDELSIWGKEINDVDVPEEVLNTIQFIREKIEDFNNKKGSDEPIEIYDRRWKKIIRLLRTSAYLNDRKSVDLMDCFLMVHCLWNTPNQIEPIKDIVSEVIRKHGYSVTLKLGMIRKELEAFEEEVIQEVFVNHIIEEKLPKDYDETYYQVLKPNNNFEGKYLKINDFNKVSTDESQIVNFYDEEFKLVNRLQTIKEKDEFSVSVTHNSQTYKLSLETVIKEKKKRIFKKPHKLVASFWGEKATQLNAFIKDQQQKLSSFKPGESDSLSFNLFIDEKLSKIVLANYTEADQKLKEYNLWLEKIEHLYR